MRTSLQKKFILVAFPAICGLTVVVSILAASKTRVALYHATEKQGRVFAQTVSALIINELIYEKLGLVEEGGLIDNYMRDLHQRSDMDLNYVAVLDNSLRITSHSDFKEFGKIYSRDTALRAQQSNMLTMATINQEINGFQALEFAVPLSIEGKRWGFLVFSMSLRELGEEIESLIFQIVFMSVLSLIFLFALLFLLNRQFIKPIIDLSEAMGEVEVEMGERTVPVMGNDEIALLAESYNDMVRRIRATNEEMKLAHEKLLQSEKLATLGVLSSSIAHRINNPLGGLFNCVRMLHKRGDEPQFRTSYLNLIEEGLQSIKDTVGQLLYTAGKRDSEERRADVAAVLETIMKFLDYRLKKQGIVFSQELEQRLTVPVAPHDLEEIFLNILINAIQAMESGGHLNVRSQRLDGKIKIIIEDSGTGIDEEHLPHVFDLFFSTKQTEEGTGIGMWMTYELVKKYKGDITISSRQQVGTTVSLILPEVT